MTDHSALVSLARSDPSGFRRALADHAENDLARLTDTLEAEKLNDRAVEVYQHLSERDPDWAPYLFWLGRNLYYLQRRHQEAEQLLAAATDRFPKAADIASIRGINLAWGLGRYEDAVPQFRRSVALEPTSMRYHSLLAWALLSTGQIAEGVAEARLSLRFNQSGRARIESYAYLYLAGPASERRRALVNIARLFDAGVRSTDWDYSHIIAHARASGHPEADRLEVLTGVIAGESNREALESFGGWSWAVSQGPLFAHPLDHWLEIGNAIARGGDVGERFASLIAAVEWLEAPARNAALWAFGQALEAGAHQRDAVAKTLEWAGAGVLCLEAVMRLCRWHPAALASVAEPLAERLSAAEEDQARAAALYGLYYLAQAGVSIAGAGSALCELLIEADSRWFIAGFALGAAHRHAEQQQRHHEFEPAADALVRALRQRSEPVAIYLALLKHGFVPPSSHRPWLCEVLGCSQERDEVAVLGLRSLFERGDPLEDMVQQTLRGLAQPTARAVDGALDRAEALLQIGVDFEPFMPALERVFSHKTKDARAAVHRMVDRVSGRLSAVDRSRYQVLAQQRKYDQLAAGLADVPEPPPERRPRDPAPINDEIPPLPSDKELAAWRKALRGDVAIDRRRTVAGLGHRLRNPELFPLLMPAIIDALATEDRTEIMDQLSRVVTPSTDTSKLMPVVAGLLLDRDYFDHFTIRRVFELLAALGKADKDLSLAWPWLCRCMPNQPFEARLTVIELGIVAGLDGAEVTPWLQEQLDELPRLPSRGHYDDTACGHMRRAAACLAKLAAREAP